jgi:hypothetical protein
MSSGLTISKTEHKDLTLCTGLMHLYDLIDEYIYEYPKSFEYKEVNAYILNSYSSYKYEFSQYIYEYDITSYKYELIDEASHPEQEGLTNFTYELIV